MNRQPKATLRLDPASASDLAQAAELLRAGGTVAFPTETVYGLGANALDPAAVARIFAAKERPAWDPLIVHVSSSSQVPSVAVLPEHLRDRVHRLADAFWPGPLTLLLPRAPAVPEAVTAGRALVGVRVPRHLVALALLRAAAVPVAAPSANRFGHTSPTTATHVLADLDGRIDAVLNGGATAVGVESTVLDPAAMVVYRPGAVTLAQIAAVCGVQATLFVPAPDAATAPQGLPSPGVGMRHYAPRARLVLCEGSEAALQAALLLHQPNAGVMLPVGWKAQPQSATFDWGAWNDSEELAARVFAGLRALDDAGAAVIVCPLPLGDDLRAAIRDRLQKAARTA